MRTLLCMCFFLSFTSFRAAALDESSEKALKQTQDLLTDRAKRNSAGDSSKDSQKVMNQVKQFAGSEATEDEIYELSSQIFERLVHQTNGDAQKLEELIAKFQKSPESFLKSFDEKESAKLRDIASKIEPDPPRVPLKP
jgi:hypothetical protein